MQSQVLVIALPLEDDQLSPLHEWGKKFDFSHVKDVHFVHVVKKNITPLEFGMVESPDESTYKEMLPTLNQFLKEESKKILPPEYKGSVEFHVTKDFNPEDEFIEILKNVGATLAVVSTRGKSGLAGFFSSSFTEYMVKHAPCDVFVVRGFEEFKQTA